VEGLVFEISDRAVSSLASDLNSCCLTGMDQLITKYTLNPALHASSATCTNFSMKRSTRNSTECLAKDRDEHLPFFDFPQRTCSVRTTNPIESTLVQCAYEPLRR
jgi:transposase-like protein